MTTPPGATTAALVFFGCYLGASADTWLRFPGVGAAILFPPYAIVTAGLLRTPARRWWLILLAASLGDFVPHTTGGATVTLVLLSELINYARALIAAIALRHFTDEAGPFETTRGIVVYVLFALFLAPCVAAFAGAGVVVWQQAIPSYGLVWREWFLSNATTAMTLLPLLVIDVPRVRGWRRIAEAALLLVGLLGVACAVFIVPVGEGSLHPARLYWPLPFLLWAALRFGPQGTSAALLGVTWLTIWGALHGRGPFSAESPTENLLELQVFLLVVSVPLLLLSVLLRQQRALAEERRHLDTRQSLEDALREADRRKDEFLAMLGHELRNPLTPIGIAMEIVRKAAPQSQEARWARETVKRQLVQLTRLVDDLLDVSRVALGRIRLELAPVDLRDIVKNAVEATGPLLAASRHQLKVSLPDDPVGVRGDSVRLTQVVSNLLNNAAKYTEPGGHIHVSVERDDETAVISVRDDGVGIPPEALAEVFELFRQLPGARGQAQGGLGIGLTLVKRFVELHGGTVEARSAGAGQGAELLVRVPAVQARFPDPAFPPASEPGLRRTSLRVLVVDDNVDIADGLALIIGTWRHVVRTAHDGASALEAARVFNPELVLLDLGLPDLDGQEVARRLRATPAHAQVRLVSMSGFDPERARRRSDEAGFHHHLFKPIDLDALRALLEGWADAPG